MLRHHTHLRRPVCCEFVRLHALISSALTLAHSSRTEANDEQVHKYSHHTPTFVYARSAFFRHTHT